MLQQSRRTCEAQLLKLLKPGHLPLPLKTRQMRLSQTSRVKSILDMLDEGGDQDEPETYQQEPEQDPTPDIGHRPGTQLQRRPVWEDPEDSAAVVDISGRSRLRKLRHHEGEQIVTGDACLLAGLPFARQVRVTAWAHHPPCSLF